MDAVEKWMIIRFTPYKTTTLYTKMDVLPKSSLLLVSTAFKNVPLQRRPLPYLSLYCVLLICSSLYVP